MNEILAVILSLFQSGEIEQVLTGALAVGAALVTVLRGLTAALDALIGVWRTFGKPPQFVVSLRDWFDSADDWLANLVATGNRLPRGKNGKSRLSPRRP